MTNDTILWQNVKGIGKVPPQHIEDGLRRGEKAPHPYPQMRMHLSSAEVLDTPENRLPDETALVAV